MIRCSRSLRQNKLTGTKWLKRRFAEVNENEKDRIVNSAIPKNTQKATQFGLSVFNGE